MMYVYCIIKVIECIVHSQRGITYVSKWFTACDVGTYGENCSTLCGHCFETKQCHHINGTCINGCNSGYHGLLCTDGKHILNFCHNNKITKIYKLL